jgi:hypothetical protein
MMPFREASEPRGRHPERSRGIKSRFLTAEAVRNDKGLGFEREARS